MEVKNFNVEIITPSGYLFNGSCFMIVLPASAGEIGIMSHHEAVLTTLNPGKITIYDQNKSVTNSFEIESGFAEMTGEKLLILVEPKSN